MSRLTEEQRAAVECRELDILVEAGAGTGKTSTTVARYERLLSELEPSEVLVFTFTDKAATELRERVRELREAEKSDFSMSATWIGTFHGICARMLRSHPIAADVDPAFSVLDDVRADRLKRRAWDSALSRTVESDGVDLDLARFNRSSLRKGLQRAWEQLRATGMVRPELPAPAPHRSPEEIHRDLLDQALAAVGTEGIRSDTRGKIEDLAGWLRERGPDGLTFEGLRGAFSSGSDKLGPLLRTIDRAAAELAAREFGDRIWGHLGDLMVNYGDAYEALKRSHGFLDYEDLQLKTVAMLERSPAVAALYREQFREIMVDEFQDTNRLQMELIQGLRGDRTTLFTVGDEMQAIYRFRFADVRLFGERRNGTARPVKVLPLSANFRSEPAVIGAVNEIGRRMEAIIEDVRTSGEPGGVTGGTSHQFAELRAGRDPSDGVEPGAELMLTARNRWADADLGDLSPARETDGDESGGDSEGQHEAEALAVAQRIRELVEEEKVDPSRIVILFRSKTRMWLFEEALKQLRLRPYVVGGSRFWETREGVDLRSLLQVIANPLDDEALVGTLAGACCGLSPDSLWLVANARPSGEPIWPQLVRFAAESATDDDEPERVADRSRAAAFVATIESLRERQPGIPLGHLIEAAVTETGYDLVNLRRDPSGAGLANIRHVFNIADAFEAAEGRDLRGLIEWIDASTELDAEAAVATADEDAEVIRLMTCHKAKGLEFDVVFVADLGKQAGDRPEEVIWVSPGLDRGRIEFGLRIPEPDGGNIDLYGWPTMQDRATLDNTDEELRILHVATTRAKRRLILSGLADLDASPRSSESTCMADRLVRAFEIEPDEPATIEIAGPEGIEPGSAWPPSKIAVSRIGPEQAARLCRTAAIPGSPGRPDGGEAPLARPTTAALPEIPLSYSALAGFAECPTRFYATRILKMREPDVTGTHPVRSGVAAEIHQDELRAGHLDPDTVPLSRPDATRFGNAVHLLLERMAVRRWRLPSEAEVVAVLEAEGVAPDGPTIERASGMVSGFAGSALAAELGGAKLDTEQALLLKTGGAMIRGFVDLIATSTDPVLVIDYKTNRLDDMAPEEKMADYDLQRDLYALGVAKATGTPSVRTGFVFLERPDRPVFDLFGAERLTEAGERIDRLIGEIKAGRYFGGSSALFQPCGECWGCELLATRIEASNLAA